MIYLYFILIIYISLLPIFIITVKEKQDEYWNEKTMDKKIKNK